MTLHLSIGPVLALVAGVAVLLMPKLLHIVVALYLITVGVLGLLGIHALRLT